MDGYKRDNIVVFMNINFYLREGLLRFEDIFIKIKYGNWMRNMICVFVFKYFILGNDIVWEGCGIFKRWSFVRGGMLMGVGFKNL